MVYSFLWFWNNLLESLDQIKIGGFKLGFWFAQQGSIYIFVLIIFFYVANELDKLSQEEDK